MIDILNITEDEVYLPDRTTKHWRAQPIPFVPCPSGLSGQVWQGHKTVKRGYVNLTMSIYLVLAIADSK